MAHIEEDKTTQWLNDNGLSSLTDVCKKHDINLDVLLVADLDDFKALCKEAEISTAMMLKLKAAIMKVSDSVIAKQSYNPRKQIIVVSEQEKKMKDKFDAIYDKLRVTLRQNEQCEIDMESQKKTAVSTVNSSMDKIIELIELKRNNMIDEINATIIEKTTQLNQQKISANQLEQLFMDKKNELDNLTINGMENNNTKNISINQIVSESINKYSQFSQEYSNIECNISPVININEIDVVIKRACYIKRGDEQEEEIKTEEIIPNDNRYDIEDEKKEQKEEQIVMKRCKFSDRYRSNEGILSLNDDKTTLSKPYKNSQQYSFIALDIDPIRNGVHCFRIKVSGRNSFAYFGIHNDIRNASVAYDDKQSCGANIFSWHKSDTQENVNYHKLFEREKQKKSLIWDMLVTLNEYENSLRFTVVDGEKKEISIAILTKNANWTPHFILFAGGRHSNRYGDTKIKVYKIDPKLFGQKNN